LDFRFLRLQAHILLDELHVIYRGCYWLKIWTFKNLSATRISSTMFKSLRSQPLNLLSMLHWFNTSKILSKKNNTIKDLLNLDWLPAIDHTTREGNNCAHFLAKLGASFTLEFVVHTSSPTDLSDLLITNSIGTWFRRL